MNRLSILLVLSFAAACAPDAELELVTDSAAPATGNYANTSDTASMTEGEAISFAQSYIANTPKFLEGVESTSVMRSKVDKLGIAHVRYQQMERGVPVFGGEAIVHINANGSYRGITDDFVRNTSGVNVTPSLDADRAIELARTLLDADETDVTAPSAKLFVLRYKGADHLVWQVSQYVANTEGRPSQPVAFIDAHTGVLVDQFENLKSTSLTDSDKTTYNLAGSTRYSRAAVGDSSDADLNETHTSVQTTLSFLWSNYGRDSFDGNGAKVNSYGHYSRNYVNAFWDGSRLTFGDGDGINSSYLGVLDVAAHELGHALTEYEANLVYSYESGALNEAASDIFAASVEAYADGAVTTDTWDIGEDCWLASSALRYMSSPSSDGSSRDHYSNAYTGTSDNGGVHWNSGIANHFFYLLASGGQHHTAGYRSGNTVTGVGIDLAYDIWYHALSNYMTSSTNFAGARTATEAACADLADAVTCESVSYAWYEVGVGADPASGGGSTGGSTGGGSTGGSTGGTSTSCPAGYGEVTGTLASGATDSYTYTTTSSGTHDLLLYGASGTDFDLYLQKYSRRKYSTVASSTTASSSESISYSGSSGDYQIQVKSYSGAGDYTLCYILP